MSTRFEFAPADLGALRKDGALMQLKEKLNGEHFLLQD
jgi:hypothetical protein